MSGPERRDGHLSNLELEALSLGEWLGARETSAGQHLRVCSLCREELNAMRRENELFKKELALEGAAAVVTSRRWARVEASWRRLGLAARFGAAAALAALCVGLLWRAAGDKTERAGAPGNGEQSGVLVNASEPKGRQGPGREIAGRGLTPGDIDTKEEPPGPPVQPPAPPDVTPGPQKPGEGGGDREKPTLPISPKPGQGTVSGKPEVAKSVEDRVKSLVAKAERELGEGMRYYREIIQGRSTIENARMAARHFEEAEKLFSNALRLDPNHPGIANRPQEIAFLGKDLVETLMKPSKSITPEFAPADLPEELALCEAEFRKVEEMYREEKELFARKQTTKPQMDASYLNMVRAKLRLESARAAFERKWGFRPWEANRPEASPIPPVGAPVVEPPNDKPRPRVQVGEEDSDESAPVSNSVGVQRTKVSVGEEKGEGGSGTKRVRIPFIGEVEVANNKSKVYRYAGKDLSEWATTLAGLHAKVPKEQRGKSAEYAEALGAIRELAPYHLSDLIQAITKAKDDDTRAVLKDILDSAAPGQQQVPRLIQALSDTDFEVRLAALRLLAPFAKEDNAAWKAIQHASEDEDLAVAKAAAEILGKLGAEDQARRLLDLATEYLKAGKLEQAQAMFLRLVEAFPGSSVADRARTGLMEVTALIRKREAERLIRERKKVEVGER